MPIRPTSFDPAPEDAPVLDSVLDYPIEGVIAAAADADDSVTDPGVPPLVRRIAHRVRETLRGE